MGVSKSVHKRTCVAVPSKVRSAAIENDGSRVMSMELTVLSLRLRAIYATAVAVQLSLRGQAAERDLEIADALRVGVCDALGDGLREFDAIERRGSRRSG